MPIPCEPTPPFKPVPAVSAALFFAGATGAGVVAIIQLLLRSADGFVILEIHSLRKATVDELKESSCHG